MMSKNTPYQAGKVSIGLRYKRPPPPLSQDEERIQGVLLGVKPRIPNELKATMKFIVGVLVFISIILLLNGAKNV
jgi:hypothetical protein